MTIDAFGYHSAQQMVDLLSRAIRGEKVTPRAHDIEKLNTEIGKLRLLLIQKVMHVAGYIPLIGTILAAIKLYVIPKIQNALTYNQKKFGTAKDLNKRLTPEGHDWTQNMLYGFKVRAWIELTSCGAILIIPDLIVTAMRNCYPTELYPKGCV